LALLKIFSETINERKFHETNHPLSKPIAISPQLQTGAHDPYPASYENELHVPADQTRFETEGHVNTEEIITDESSKDIEDKRACASELTMPSPHSTRPRRGLVRC